MCRQLFTRLTLGCALAALVLTSRVPLNADVACNPKNDPTCDNVVDPVPPLTIACNPKNDPGCDNVVIEIGLTA